MDTVTETHGASKDVTDLYGNPFHATLAEVVEHLSHAPYWHVDEKAPARLVRAAQLIRQSRVQLHDAHRATVYGTTRAYDLDGFACTCPASQKGSTHWCVHAVTVKLARTLEERMQPNPSLPLGPVTIDDRLAQPATVELGTLRAGTRPLPPTTVDERLAQPPTDTTWRDVTQDELMADADAHEAQGDDMPADEYIPEPDTDHVATATQEPPETTAATSRPLPGPVLLPSLDARTLEQSMQAWAEQRQVVKRFIQTQLVDGTDYYTLQMGQRTSKPTLSKAGSEKFLGLFQLHATFTQDTATWTMLGEPKGTLCYVCHLLTRTGEVVSEGRGAREVLKEKDINKAIKMAQKSAQIDAVLRTGALSEAFTQDINDEDDQPVQDETPAKPTSADLRKRIWAHIYKAAPQVKTQDAAVAWVKEQTGLDMHPDHYAAILEKIS